MGTTYELVIRNARLANVEGFRDIAIKDQEIAIVSKRVEKRAKKEVDAEGRLTSPSFVDPHMHLDEAFSGGDAKWDSRERLDAVELARQTRDRGFTYRDVKGRARKSAEMALLNGTTALRTHVGIDPVIGMTSLKSILDLKKECVKWIDIQPVAFVLVDSFVGVGESLLKEALNLGVEVLGGVPRCSSPENEFDVLFKIAQESNVAIDIHVDEHNDPDISLLETFAAKALTARSQGYAGSVSASHCCSLSAVSDEVAARVIRKIKFAKMNVIANPLTNIYLRRGGRPNGLTRVRELLNSDVNVAYGTDNMQDMFNPLGNADMLLAGLFLAYFTELERGKTLDDIFRMGTFNAAKCGVIQNHDIKKGCKADIMILDAENPQEAIMGQARRLYVIKNGNMVVENGRLTI